MKLPRRKSKECPKNLAHLQDHLRAICGRLSPYKSKLCAGLFDRSARRRDCSADGMTVASLWHQIVSVSLAVAFWGEMGSVASRCAELLMARLTYSLCIQRSNLVKGLPPPAADPRRSQAGILQPPTCGSIQSRTLSLELYIYMHVYVVQDSSLKLCVKNITQQLVHGMF